MVNKDGRTLSADRATEIAARSGARLRHNIIIVICTKKKKEPAFFVYPQYVVVIIGHFT